MKLGPLLRKMGLPFWTFMGISFSGLFVNYVGTASEVLIKDLLLTIGISETWANGLPPFIVLVLTIGTVIALAAWQGRRIKAGIGTKFGPAALSQPEGKRGIILLVSRTESAMEAIRYHYITKATLRYVWLLPSNDIECERFGSSSLPDAIKIQDECGKLKEQVKREQGVERPLDVMIHQGGVSPADAQDTFDAVNRIYRTAFKQGLQPSDIIVDFTGGTKPMSVGMIMAALPVERTLQYIAFNPATRQMYGPFSIDYQHDAFDLIG
jgi:hypothetical protein